MRVLSFSAIEKFLKCSWFYYLWYVVKDRPNDASVATLAGSIAHEVLEDYYGPVVNRELDADYLLDLKWQSILAKYGFPAEAFNVLKSIQHDMARLFERAAEGYSGTDAIRNKDRSVPKKPMQTTAWADAVRALGIDRRQAVIDIPAATKNPDWVKNPLSVVFSETYVFLGKYKDPIPNHTIEHIEMEFGNDDDPTTWVYLPGTQFRVKGKIDVTSHDHHKRLFISDHKSSQTEPYADKVKHWEQIIMYGFSYHALKGRYPDYAAINSLRHGKFVVAQFDPRLIPGMLQRKIAAAKAIQAEAFVGRNPTDYNSPCWNEFTKEPCAFLAKCHPEFAHSMGVS